MTLPSDRASRVEEIVATCRRRRAAGESLADDDVIAAHPDLMPELGEALRRLSLIAAARRDAAEGAREVVRCPRCRHRIDLDAQRDPLLTCPECDERLRVIPDEPPVPDGIIGHFELLERVGTGSFGSVWRARDRRLERIVAVKIPRRGRAGDEAVDAFLREARMAARLSHPSIVTVHEVGVDGPWAFIVSDLVEGRTLVRWRAEEQPGFDDMARVAAGVARALHVAHEAGIVHRDLKPENVMVDADGLPRVMDFGLAIHESDQVTITHSGRVVGTPAYMPPEQARGDAIVDRRADVWALGAVLYELLTGELPFRGNPRVMLANVLEHEPTLPRKIEPGIPRDLETICLKCLEKEPRRRFQTADHLADDLARFVDGRPIASRPVSPWTRAWLSCRRRPLVPSLIASLVVVVVGATVLAWRAFADAADDLDRSLTRRALEADLFTAQSVGAAVGQELERRFRAVAEAAADPELHAALDALSAGDVAKLLDRLRTESPHRTSAARRTLVETPARARLQTWLGARATNDAGPRFCWFVTGALGLQLARVPPAPEADTLGRPYAWRSYFHGGARDAAPEDLRPRQPLREGPRLSAVFLTERTDHWVVAVSCAIPGRDRPRGVVGVMLELGALARLPGGPHDREIRFPVLVDVRTTPPGRVLQHPAYLVPRHARERLDLSQLPEYCSPLGQETSDAYRDPFARLDRKFDQRWLAARAPITVHGRTSGIEVVVQQSHRALIGASLRRMRRTLIWVTAAALVLATVATATLWRFVMRLVAR